MLLFLSGKLISANHIKYSHIIKDVSQSRADEY